MNDIIGRWALSAEGELGRIMTVVGKGGEGSLEFQGFRLGSVEGLGPDWYSDDPRFLSSQQSEALDNIVASIRLEDGINGHDA